MLRATSSRPIAAALLLATVVAWRPLAAQIIPDPSDEPTGGPSASASAAYLALSVTPVGALAAPADYLLARPGMAAPPLRLHGRFASLDRGVGIGQRTWAASLDMPVGGVALALTGGYVDITCDDIAGDPALDLSLDCKGGLTLGGRFGAPFYSRTMDAAGTTALVVGTELTAGYADISIIEGQVFGAPLVAKATAMSATVAIPFALSVRSGTVTVAPMLVPRFGYGRATGSADGLGAAGEDDTKAGGRFMLGAGVAVRLGQHLGFEAGMQKVFVEDGETAYGLGLSVGF